MSATIHLHAQLKEIFRGSSVSLTLQAPQPIATLRQRLIDVESSAAALISKSHFALNDEYVEETAIWNGSERIDLIPPVSGG
jgi:molybdopterin converting factor small subunit